ncbi:hypothetical protein [Streptomyces sp. H51]|uniref:hypothetical protein n=1 Tax=Streptomyces sp. H51 TaxID=3111770 RepID=UPI002D7A1B21|nr:hypothetical protein [Streptomyces sp. H51]
MGTTLTPEFWERFAVLLVAAMAVTCALAALFDALAVRSAGRHGSGPAGRHRRGPAARAGRRPTGADHRTAVGC